MAIAIVVEDGSGVVDSNSYVSVSDFREYATNRGVVLPVDDDRVASFLVQAMDYLEAQASRFQGLPVFVGTAWPRTGVVFNGVDFSETAIPTLLVKAQCALGIAASQGINLLPNIGPRDFVIEKTVGPLTTKYANPIQAGVETQFTGVEALLGPLFDDGSGWGTLRSRRV